MIKQLDSVAILFVLLGLLGLPRVIAGPVGPSIPDKEGGDLALDLGDGVKMELVWVDALNGWVGKYEVTYREYRLFKPDHSNGTLGKMKQPQQPVVTVTYYDAVAFCEWLNRRGGLPEGSRVRLPDGDEWMVYAQCGDGRQYPWGNELPPKYGNYSTGIAGYNDGSPLTCDVTLSGENDWGLYGVGGNVREWTSEMDGQSIGHPNSWRVDVGRVVRGASWFTGSGDDLRCAYRSIVHPVSHAVDIGFRVVMRKSGWDLLPPFKQVLQSWDAVRYRVVVKPARHGTSISEEIQVSNPLRVRNPNHFTVEVGIRAGSKGMNFHVGANGDETVYIPEGRYDIYFVFSDKPDALFQGNAFNLNNSSAQIKLMLDVDGKTPDNYRIRQVK